MRFKMIENLAFLMANDSDGFNQYEAAQALGLRLLKGMIKDESGTAGF